MVPGIESNHWHVSARGVIIGLGTDIGYEKDGNQPIEKYTSGVTPEHVFRQSLQACVAQVGSIEVSSLSSDWTRSTIDEA